MHLTCTISQIELFLNGLIASVLPVGRRCPIFSRTYPLKKKKTICWCRIHKIDIFYTIYSTICAPDPDASTLVNC